jgi:hypothetical protein
MIGFFLRRFRWLIMGAGVKYVARRGVGKSVDEAAARIEERLPATVVKAANVLPGDLIKAGGAAAVSARAAQRGARVAKTGGVVAARVTRAGVSLRSRPGVADRIRSAREAVSDQADLDARDLRSDVQRYLVGGQAGERAATEALLDLRSPRSDDPLPTVPEPIRRGRHRFVRALPGPEVARVQRTYRRPQKPWDRRR